MIYERTGKGTMTYWLHLFTGTTWKEFRQAGAAFTGFRQHHWQRARKVKPGDLFLCYMVGVKRWVGLLQVTGECYQDDKPIWGEEPFPVRIPVKPLALLTAETGVPMKQLEGQLSFFKKGAGSRQWSNYVRVSLRKYQEADGVTITHAVQEAQRNPVKRQVDAKKLNRSAQRRRPAHLYKTKISTDEGDVETVLSVPTNEEDEQGQETPSATNASTATQPTGTFHTEIQYRLLELGARMGLQVWAPKSDRGKVWNGHAIDKIPGLLRSLPTTFDNVTNRIVENIDVIWLSPQNRSAIVAAFEVEHSTAIYSGLLRMCDLLTMQPNIDIKLYIVAPDERFDKFKRELPRPTFACRKKPLHKVCGFISYSKLRNTLDSCQKVINIKHVKPEFLEDITERYDPAQEMEIWE
ncbi:MAG: EVE domain-containing protein [Myxococcota bacterium]